MPASPVDIISMLYSMHCGCWCCPEQAPHAVAMAGSHAFGCNGLLWFCIVWHFPITLECDDELDTALFDIWLSHHYNSGALWILDYDWTFWTDVFESMAVPDSGIIRNGKIDYQSVVTRWTERLQPMSLVSMFVHKDNELFESAHFLE